MEALVDVDAGRTTDHQSVQAWAESLSTDTPLHYLSIVIMFGIFLLSIQICRQGTLLLSLVGLILRMAAT